MGETCHAGQAAAIAAAGAWVEWPERMRQNGCLPVDPASIGMNSMLRFLLVLLAFPLMTTSPPRANAASEEAEKEAILALITRMEEAWNRGDFRGYMEGFANPDVVFVSRGRFQKDWQGTLDHYVRDYGASEATRGRLRFFDIQIEMLAPDTAQLISRYQLDRPQNPQDGINTRLMRKRDGKWVIALNHVSSQEVPCKSTAE
jgi:uncharacterized protein (TIGR02246 family)